MSQFQEILTSILTAIGSAGGMGAILGMHAIRKSKQHHNYKIELDIKVAKLETEVRLFKQNIYPALNDIKTDIRTIRDKLDSK